MFTSVPAGVSNLQVWISVIECDCCKDRQWQKGGSLSEYTARERLVLVKTANVNQAPYPPIYAIESLVATEEELSDEAVRNGWTKVVNRITKSIRMFCPRCKEMAREILGMADLSVTEGK